MSIHISIIIPTKDEEKLLPACLESLLPQLTKNDEIIIVDAGSIDKTIELAQNYGCKVLVYGKSSIGQARDYGVSQAKNEIILQTDADLVFDTSYIDKLRQHYMQNPYLAGVTGGWRDAQGRILANITLFILEKTLKESDCAVSYTKTAYYKTGLHPNTSFGEQIFLWTQIMRTGPTIYDPTMIVHHYSNQQTRIPSYIIGAGLTGAGTVTGNLSMVGAGLGFASGQVFSDRFAYLEEQPHHYHHFHLGATVSALGATLYGSEPKYRNFWSAIFWLGTGILLQDLITTPTN